MRHDTPSTARWWIVSSRRPATSAPASNHTACTITPAAGDSRAAAACACAPMTVAPRLVAEASRCRHATDKRGINRARGRDLKTPTGVSAMPASTATAAHRGDQAKPAAHQQGDPGADPPELAAASPDGSQSIRPPHSRKPAHDRRRRNYAARHVGQSRRGLLDKGSQPPQAPPRSGAGTPREA